MLEPWCALCLLCFWPSGMYPMDQSEYPGLRSAIERLTLNDSSVTVQRDSSLALGAGWRWGPNRLAQQTSTYALVTNQKKNAKVLLNQSRLLGAWLFAVSLKNADEAAKWSISLFSFFFLKLGRCSNAPLRKSLSFCVSPDGESRILLSDFNDLV